MKNEIYHLLIKRLVHGSYAILLNERPTTTEAKVHPDEVLVELLLSSQSGDSQVAVHVDPRMHLGSESNLGQIEL